MDRTNPFQVFLIFLKLGLTSFGGPIAHLGYFRREFVERRKWLTEHAYSDLVSLCQFLPGPASSQVGIGLGLSKGGILGAIAAWLGFTLPSAVMLVLFGLGLASFGGMIGVGWLHGLKVVSVAVVAQAIWAMGKSLCPDMPRASIAILSAAAAILIPTSTGQIIAISGAALLGLLFLRTSATLPHEPVRVGIKQSTGAMLLSLFFIFLFVLPVASIHSGSYALKLFEGFYRAGALVFGGGHVVLPLLQSEVVPRGWVSNDAFLAGYGAAQAVPGPLFTFAAYLGAVSSQTPSGWIGGAIALVAIFLPSFLLVIGILPFWENLRKFRAIQRAMLGINAAVVGILAAAFYNPVWTASIRGLPDFLLAASAFLVLVFLKWPPWLVVFLSAGIAGLFAL